MSLVWDDCDVIELAILDVRIAMVQKFLYSLFTSKNNPCPIIHSHFFMTNMMMADLADLAVLAY